MTTTFRIGVVEQNPTRIDEDCHVNDSRAIANFFIRKYLEWRSKNKTATDFKLNSVMLEKIVFISQAFHIQVFDKPLIEEPILIGRFDPYFKLLRDSLIYYGNEDLQFMITEDHPLITYLYGDKHGKKYRPKLTISQQELMNAIWGPILECKAKCHHLSHLSRGGALNWKKLNKDIATQKHSESLSLAEIMELFPIKNLAA